MTAQVIQAFAHEYNRAAVAEQEYEAAKEHYHQVLTHRNPLNPEHNRRFRDASDRLDMARQRWLAVMRV